LSGGVVAGKGQERKVEVTENGRQQIIKVVRHAACQHAKTFQFLGVLKLAFHFQALGFGALLVGDIENITEEIDRLPAIVVHDRGIIIDPAILAIGAHQAVLLAKPGRLVVQVIDNFTVDPHVILWVDQRRIAESTGGEIFRRIPKLLLNVGGDV
jgi:hypothetical protein